MNVRLFFLMVLSGYAPAVASDNVVTNGGFEAGLSGWRVWSRAPDAIASTLDTQTVHRGQTALRLEHRGAEDWSLEPTVRLEVQPGELLELECWLKVQGGGVATLCASTWDTQGTVAAWSYGERAAYEGPDWQHLQTRFVVPANIRQVQPRLIGYGPATVWVDDYAAVQRGNLGALRTANLPATLALRNAVIEVTFNTADGALSVHDLRTWKGRSDKTKISANTAHAFFNYRTDPRTPRSLAAVCGCRLRALPMPVLSADALPLSSQSFRLADCL